MDLQTTLLIAIAASFIGFVIGAIVCFFVKEAFMERKIARLTQENHDLDTLLYSAQQKERNTKGLAAKEDLKQAEVAVFGQVLSSIENIPQVKEFIGTNPQLKAMIDMGKSNPEMGLKLAKKMAKEVA